MRIVCLVINLAAVLSHVILGASAAWATAGRGRGGGARRDLQLIDDYCEGNHEEMAVLDFLLDSNPEETGYKLVCDHRNEDDKTEQVTVWDVEVGSLDPIAKETWVYDNTCVSKRSTCVFTVYDGSGDGLLGDGWFALRYGATTVAVSNYQGDNDPFTTDTYCFGPNCDTLPLERAEDQQQQDEEEEEAGDNEVAVDDEDEEQEGGEEDAAANDEEEVVEVPATGGSAGDAESSQPTVSSTTTSSSSGRNEVNIIVASILGAVGFVLLVIGFVVVYRAVRKKSSSAYRNVTNEKGSDTNSDTTANDNHAKQQAIYSRNDDMEESMEFGACQPQE